MPVPLDHQPLPGMQPCVPLLPAGDTPILMADGRTGRSRDLSRGRPRSSAPSAAGSYRRYVDDRGARALVDGQAGVPRHARGRHRAHHERRPPLPDEPRLEARHGRGARAGRRPHLTTQQRAARHGPLRRAARRRRTTTGAATCAGWSAATGTSAPTRTSGRAARTGDVHRFRLALADLEALRARAVPTSLDAGVATDELRVRRRRRRPPRGQRRSARRRERRVERIRELIAWPLSPSDDWRKGFLAGIFDAEGSLRAEALRIANTRPRDPRLDRRACLGHFGFDRRRGARADANGRQRASACAAGCANGCASSTSPTRRSPASGTVAGHRAEVRREDARRRASSRSASRCGCTTSRPAPATSSPTAWSATTASPARRTRTSTSTPGRDFEKEIVVKVNVPEVLRVELARPSWKGEHVAMGTNTDPYQWVEGRYKLMRGIWEALRDFGEPVLDPDEVAAAAARPRPDEARSPAVDGHQREPLDPDDRREGVAGDRAAHAATRRRGWRRWRELNRAGIPCGILVAPLMPGINDDARAGRGDPAGWRRRPGRPGSAASRCTCAARCAAIFMDWLRSYRPDLVPRYEELYARGRVRAAGEQERLSALVAARAGATRTPRSAPSGASRGRGLRAACARRRPAAERPPRAPRSEQTKLVLMARWRAGAL